MANGKYALWQVSMKQVAGFTLPALSTVTIAPQRYRVKLDGTGLTRLTTSEGSHRVDFSPTFSYFTDVSSDLNTPSQLRLFSAEGKLVRVIEENRVDALAQYKLGKPSCCR